VNLRAEGKVSHPLQSACRLLVGQSFGEWGREHSGVTPQETELVVDSRNRPLEGEDSRKSRGKGPWRALTGRRNNITPLVDGLLGIYLDEERSESR
jgi:hypothetical protein